MSKTQEKQNLGEKYKITVSTGKIITLKDLTIDDQREAAKDAGMISDSKNEASLGVELQYALLKRLIVKINGNVLSGQQKEILKDHLTFAEYSEIMIFVQELMGKVQAPKVEFIS
jgi:hypothetical protein